MQVTPDPKARWQDALLAARLIAMAGPALGGIRLRAGVGPVRQAWLEKLASLAGSNSLMMIPANATQDRLCGGIDIHATLSAGALRTQRGLLATADGRIAVLSGAERLETGALAAICAALDTGLCLPSHAANSSAEQSRFALIALDEAVAGEAGPAEALCERLAIDLSLDGIAWSAIKEDDLTPSVETSASFRHVNVSDALIETADTALRQPSPRRLHLVIRIAKAIAALERRTEVSLRDVLTAVRLAAGDSEAAEDIQNADQQPQHPAEQASRPEQSAQNHDQDANSEQPIGANTDFAIAAEAANITGIELTVRGLSGPNRLAGMRGSSGEKRKKAKRGRVIGMRERAAYPDARPDLLATLSAAAPWQAIRRIERAQARVATNQTEPNETHRPIIRVSDFRFRHYQDKRESAVLFAVDASGSTAMDRLGEAKGAVELLLADCYAKRHQVGLVAFRGQTAETLLSPTRSLVRAKRGLQALPGGGATPLASGLKRGLELALVEKSKGRTPLLVLISDGSGNIALDGSQGRQKGTEDALGLARLIAHHRIASIVIDIGRRGSARGEPLARAMGAQYRPLPYASARSMSGVIETQISNARR
jgi:magnesium chelatase subunit D